MFKGKMLSVAVKAAAVALAASVFVSCGEKSPDELFRASAKNAFITPVKNAVSSSCASLKGLKFDDVSSESEMKIELGSAGKSLLSLLEVEDELGFSLDWISSLNMKFGGNISKDSVGYNFKAGLNDVDVFSVDLIVDRKNPKLYFTVPELISKYISIEGDGVENYVQQLDFVYDQFAKILSAFAKDDELNGLLDELADSILNPVTGVVKSDRKLTAGSGDEEVSADYYALDFTLSEETSGKIVESVKKNLSKSSNLKSILTSMNTYFALLGGGVDPDEIVDSFVEAVCDGIENAAFYEPVITMFSDKEGNCAGFEVSIYNVPVVKCYAPSVNGKFAVDATVASFKLSGAGKSENGLVTGEFTADAFGSDLFTVSAENFGNNSGKFAFAFGSALTEYLLEDIPSYDEEARAMVSMLASAKLAFDIKGVTAGSGEYDVSLLDASDAEYLKMNVKAKAGKAAALAMPENAVDADDDEVEDMFESATLEKIADNLDKASVPSFITQEVRALTMWDLLQ